jgi:hypothetical protein
VRAFQRGRSPLVLVSVAALAAYAWWATGVAPFTGRAYIVVGIPVAAVAVGAALDRRGDGSPILSPNQPRPSGPGAAALDAALPWALLGAVALALELVALALGGRSNAVPTLSTVVDHALSRHPVRFVLFCAWLAVAGVPLLRRHLGYVTGPESGSGGMA